MGPALLALPGFALLLAIVWAGGRRLVRLLLPSIESAEATLLGFVLGMAGLSVAVTLLLFARFPLRIHLPLLLIPVLWLGLRDLRPIFDALRAAASDRLHAALVVIYAVLGLVGCLAPETGWDTGVYHFTMAKLRAEEGWMVVRYDIPHSFRPSYMESLYAVGFAFRSETFAALFNFAVYFGGLALARHWAGRVAGPGARRFAGLAYLACTTYVLRTGGGDVEAGQALFLGAALYSLFRLREGGDRGYRLVVAVCLGMTLGIKYAGAWAVVGIVLVWPFVRRRDRLSWSGLAGECALLASVGLLVASPWYLRNLLVTGSALYPWGGEAALSGGSLAAEGLRAKALANVFGPDLSIAMAAPALLAAATARLRWAAVSLGLFALLVGRQMGVSEPSLANGFRYFSPAFLVLHVLAGCGAAEALRKGPPWRWIAVGFLVTCLVPALAIHALRNGRKAPVALGLEPRETYLERRIDSLWAVRRAEGLLAPGRRILLVEQRAYYCRAPFLTASDIQTHVRFDDLKDAAALREFLGREGIGAIVWSRSPVAKTWGFRRLIDRIPDLPRAGVRVVEERPDTVLYAVD